MVISSLVEEALKSAGSRREREVEEFEAGGECG